MIKIEQSHESTSYWKQDNLYDKRTKTSRRIKLFGLTIYNNSYTFDCDLVKEKEAAEDNKSVGFHAKNQNPR